MVKGTNKKVNGLRVNQCPAKARIFLGAWGGKSWEGVYCEKHSLVILKKRRPMIKKYKQNVVYRYITDYDIIRRKQVRRIKKEERRAKAV